MQYLMPDAEHEARIDDVKPGIYSCVLNKT